MIKKKTVKPPSKLNDEFSMTPQQKQVPLTDETFTQEAVISSLPAVVDIPKLPAIKKAFDEVGSITAAANALTIASDHDYEVAAQIMMRINTAIKELTSKQKGMTEKLSAVVKSIKALFAPKLADLESAKELYRAKLGAYDDKRIQLAEQRRKDALAAEAQQKAELEAQAERERQEAAARQQAADEESTRLQQIADDAQNAASAAAEGGDTESADEAAKIARRAKAEQLKLANRREQESEDEANRIAAIERQKSTVFVPTPPPPVVPKISGIARRVVWKWELLDVKKLPPNYLMANADMIEREVQGMHDVAEGYFGGAIRVWSETSIAGGSK